MPLSIPIQFPSEAEALRRHLQSEKDLNPTERLRAADDLLTTVEILSHAGGVRSAALIRHAEAEDDWHRRMREFIANHVSPN